MGSWSWARWGKQWPVELVFRCQHDTLFWATSQTNLSKCHETSSRSCGKRFYGDTDHLLTLHFVHMVSATNDGAYIEVRDGTDDRSRLIASVPVRNYTRPESIVTTANNLFIKFRSKAKVRTEVFMEVTAAREKAYDFLISDSVVERNGGRGVWVEKMRSRVHVQRTTVRGHNYVAGVDVNWGAGDVNITHSDISDNFVDGVNITYGGGNKNVSWSTISNNVGMGLALWFNESTVNAPVRQETIIQYSNISLNYDIGALVGNFCGPSIVNVSGSNFLYGRYVGLEVLSCWRDSALHGVEEGLMRLEVGHNHFQHNEGVAVKLSPLARETIQ